MFKENNNFEKFESKVWLSSPTLPHTDAPEQPQTLSFPRRVEMSEKQIVSVYESYGSRKLIHNMLRAYISPSMGEHSIDGIFTSSDHLAMIVQEELEEMGKRVPEDIQIIGYDGLQFLNQGKPIVSSIAQPVHEIAKEAVRCLNELIANGKTEGNTKIPVSFQEGPTTKTLVTEEK